MWWFPDMSPTWAPVGLVSLWLVSVKLLCCGTTTFLVVKGMPHMFKNTKFEMEFDEPR